MVVVLASQSRIISVDFILLFIWAKVVGVKSDGAKGRKGDWRHPATCCQEQIVVLNKVLKKEGIMFRLVLHYKFLWSIIHCLKNGSSISYPCSVFITFPVSINRFKLLKTVLTGPILAAFDKGPTKGLLNRCARFVRIFLSVFLIV